MTRQSGKSETIWSKIWVPLIIAGVSAFGGYLFSTAKEHRRTQIDHVTAQLDRLYRPLRLQLEANGASWADFTKKFPERSAFFDGNPRTKHDIEIWQNYIHESAQPSNLQMEETISKNVELFVGGRIPKMFTLVIAHTENYKAVIAGWKGAISDDVRTYTSKENTTLVNFPAPDRLEACLNEQIKSLEEVREELKNPLAALINEIKETVPSVCDEANQVG